MRVVGYLVLGVALAGNAIALEASAGNDTVNSTQVGINAKIDASTSLLQSAVNGLTNRIKVCSNKQALYSPGNMSADPDGCVPITVDLTDALANKDIQLYKDYKTASVAIPPCYNGGRFGNCMANVNIKALVPDDAQGLQISFPTGQVSNGGAWRQTANFQVDANNVTTCQTVAFGTNVWGCPVSGGDGSYQFANLVLTNGVGYIRSGQGRTGGGAALGGMLTVKYFVLKGKLVPAGS